MTSKQIASKLTKLNQRIKARVAELNKWRGEAKQLKTDLADAKKKEAATKKPAKPKVAAKPKTS